MIDQPAIDFGPPPPARARARRTDPHTSREAAATLTEVALTQTRSTILARFRDVGALDYPMLVDLMADSGHSPQSIRSRCKELRDAGLIEAIPGVFTRSSSGRRQQVFALSDAGRKATA